MTIEEKINLLQEYDDMAILSDEQFEILKDYSIDNDNTVRRMVAPLLIDFINENSKNILLQLAQDEDELVRTEAFDSLSVFPYNDVLDFLQEAISSETSRLARSYAILSWADVVVLLKRVSVSKIEFAKNKKETEKFNDCALSWCYALFMFGIKESLNELLQFLKSGDYQIRCATLSLLSDIIDSSNETCIKNAVEQLLVAENSEAVRDRAERFLKEN